MSAISFNISAEIEYLSIQKVITTSPLIIKLNIVEKGESLPLRFILESNHQDKLLESKRLNQFMLSVNSKASINVTHSVPNIIHVYEYKNQEWKGLYEINLQSTTISAKQSHDLLHQQKKASGAIANQPVVTDALLSSKDCIVPHKKGQTLWSIASENYRAWNTNIYGAMIAIFEQNKEQFTNKKINQLKSISVLFCPSIQQLASQGTKKEMKALFDKLSLR